MRITGGTLRGRLIKAPRAKLRPTQDKVRAAIFSSLSGLIDGARVLDLFAGSGAMGFEALSRGAAFVCWVEADSKSCRAIVENASSLRVAPSRIKLVKFDAIRFISREQGAPFDIIFADPPYEPEGLWLKKLLSALSRGSILKAGGLLIMEQDARAPVSETEGWTLSRDKAYGGTRVCFFVKNPGNQKVTL